MGDMIRCAEWRTTGTWAHPRWLTAIPHPDAPDGAGEAEWRAGKRLLNLRDRSVQL